MMIVQLENIKPFQDNIEMITKVILLRLLQSYLKRRCNNYLEIVGGTNLFLDIPSDQDVISVRNNIDFGNIYSKLVKKYISNIEEFEKCAFKDYLNELNSYPKVESRYVVLSSVALNKLVQHSYNWQLNINDNVKSTYDRYRTYNNNYLYFIDSNIFQMCDSFKYYFDELSQYRCTDLTGVFYVQYLYGNFENTLDVINNSGFRRVVIKIKPQAFLDDLNDIIRTLKKHDFSMTLEIEIVATGNPETIKELKNRLESDSIVYNYLKFYNRGNNSLENIACRKVVCALTN